MFKQMKLSSKLYLSFGIMIVIAVIVGYIGYSSLGKVGHKVNIGDEANRFVKIINTARLAEKNFIMRGHEKYGKEMLAQKEAFDVLVKEITSHMQVAADKKLVAEMHIDAGIYIDNAKKYIELQGNIDELTAISGPIVESARKTIKLADDMTHDQEKKLAAVMNVQANIADGSRAHLQWAGAVKDFLADENAKLNVQTDGNQCGFGKWLNSNEFTEQAAYCGQEFRDLIADAKEKHLELHKSAIDIANARQGMTDTALTVYQQKTAPILNFILGEFVRAEKILKTKVSERLANADDAKQINVLLLATRQQEKNYFFRNEDEYIKKTNDTADRAIALANDLKKRFNQQINKDQVQEAIDAFITYKKAFADVVNDKNEQKTCEAEMLVAARKLTKEAVSLQAAKKEEMISVIDSSNLIMIVLVIASVLIGSVLSFIITRSISGPINKMVTMVNEMGMGRLGMRLNMDRSDEIGQMAKTMDSFADDLQNVIVRALQQLSVGDLTFEASQKDDKDVIGAALVKTSDDLNRMVGEILAATEQIAAGSGQVSDSSQALSQGATESAAALEQITSSMTEMGSQTTTNAENATQANQLATQARGVAETGNDQMKNMVTAMGEINDAGQSISKIIKVIDEIAFQTNLLALNAAVEAARAGRHGKGFAVVAEEVRNLAARSAKAAKETAELIEGSVEKTRNGTEIANQTAESLGEIVNHVTRVTDLVGEIAAASNEQAEGISQVNSGLGQIDQVTQQNTASAEEGAAAAEELSSQAVHLKGLMSTFRVKGGSAMTSAAQPALPQPVGSSQNNASGWDSSPDPQPDPSEIIALDDKEFGRY